MDTQPLTIDGVAGPVVVTTHALWGHPAVTVAGQTAPRVGKRQYALPATNGATVQATLRAGFADPYPTLEINGARHRTGPKVPVVLQVLTALPIALVAVGGLIGGLLGALGLIVNLGIARSRMPAVIKALLMVGVALAALVALLVIVTALRGAASQG